MKDFISDFVSAKAFAREMVRSSLETEIPDIKEALKVAQQRRNPIISTRNTISEAAKILIEKKGYEVTGEKEISAVKEIEKLIGDEKEIEKLLEDIRNSAEKRRQSQKYNQ